MSCGDDIEDKADGRETEEHVVERQVLDWEGEGRGRETEESENSSIPELRTCEKVDQERLSVTVSNSLRH